MSAEVSSKPEERRWQGLSVSEGIVVGRVLRIHKGTKHAYPARFEVGDMESEISRFREAVQHARNQLLVIKERAAKLLGRDHAYIFDAHLLMLEDRKLTDEIESYIIAERANAEWAVRVIGDRLLSVYAEIKDDYLRERGSDIEDVIHRVLEALSGERPAYLDSVQEAVIVSEDLLPSAAGELDLEHARAILTDAGGWTSHTAIIARGLAIPAMVGLEDLCQHAHTGDEIVVDSYKGEVILHPTSATLAETRSEIARRQSSLPTLPGDGTGKVKTKDGVLVRLLANVELPVEFEGIKKYGAAGIGLYRSEFLLAQPGAMLSEETQYDAYVQVAQLAGESGAVVRLFDLGGDKSGDAIIDSERNPALGLRAIRFCLRNEAVLRTQVRAILRAATKGRLDIVLPMVADVADVRSAQKIIAGERANLEAEGQDCGPVRIGAMIEVPSAVMTAEKIAAVVEFFELGTNDLVQYVMAVDRGNDKVAGWFRSLHPAVLASISRTLKAAKGAGIPAIVCGEMASTPVYAVVLIGLGATELSMTPSSIPRVTRVLNGIDSTDAVAIANECLQMASADEVEDLVRERFLELWPNLFTPKTLPAVRPEEA
ncbi:MAG TPA: phosphoenolpyruvate--protein phosphotransferase [Pyrinomonadaceae bacterium]|nr:phosphoenolpyruvate--protein phosphotransferase [Pyrinomonadaceae bacterium]